MLQGQRENNHLKVFPCKLRVLPQFVFNSRDPIIMGVSVEAGFLANGTPICVPSKEVSYLLTSNLYLVGLAVIYDLLCMYVCVLEEPYPSGSGRWVCQQVQDSNLIAVISTVRKSFRKKLAVLPAL